MLERANEILAFDAFELDKWDVVGSWDQTAGCHNQSYFPKENIRLAGAAIPAGRRILAVQSHEYDAVDQEMLCRTTDLEIVDIWSASEEYWICYLCPDRRN